MIEVKKLLLFYRFGIVLVVDEPEDSNGRTNVAVGLARAFYFIKNDENSESAFKFLSQAYAYKRILKEYINVSS